MHIEAALGFIFFGMVLMLFVMKFLRHRPVPLEEINQLAGVEELRARRFILLTEEPVAFDFFRVYGMFFRGVYRCGEAYPLLRIPSGSEKKIFSETIMVGMFKRRGQTIAVFEDGALAAWKTYPMKHLQLSINRHHEFLLGQLLSNLKRAVQTNLDATIDRQTTL